MYITRIRSLALLAVAIAAIAFAPACGGQKPPTTPAQIAYSVKTVGAQVEASLVALGHAATGVREVVRGLHLPADKQAQFDQQFAQIQRAADTAITEVEQFSTGTAPVLQAVHASVQTLANLWTPFVGLVKAFDAGNQALAVGLDAATAGLNTVLALTAPSGV